MRADDKVIITCALTGAVTTRRQCEAIPYTPVEIAEEAKRAWEAGAAVVHIHAREDDGSPSWRADVFEAIARETRARCPVILNFSTGGAGPMSERCEHVRRVRPEMAALNMGSMNYAKYSPKRKDFVFEFVFQNPFSDIKAFLEVMREAGSKPELECFDIGHTNSIGPLLDMGILKQPIQFSFIMGVMGGLAATMDNLAMQTRQIPTDSTWEVIGISTDQWKLIAGALALGGNIRVGLEDNFYLDAAGTQMAKSNGDLVAKAARMARDIGREPATVEEAKALLSIGKAW
jgi:3-keto-5-aminohexanoate cleavage enzyme